MIVVLTAFHAERIVVAGPSHKMTLTRFAGGRPDVTYELPTERADPLDFTGGVSADAGRHSDLKSIVQAQQRFAP